MFDYKFQYYVLLSILNEESPRWWGSFEKHLVRERLRTVKMSDGRGVSRLGWIMDSRLGRWPSLEPTKNNLTEDRGYSNSTYTQSKVVHKGAYS